MDWNSSLIVAPGSAVMESRASLENPRVSLQDPDAWDEIFGGGRVSASGLKVTHDGALDIAAVWQVVSMISGDIAKLPLDVYRYQPDESRQADLTHPARKIVRRMANEEKSAFQFWRTLMVHALLWNNGYAYIERNGRGDPIGLYNMLPDRTTPERHGGKLYYVTETTREDGSPWLRPVPAADVFHLHGLALDNVRGFDLVEAARDSFGLTLAAQGFAAKFFKHGVRSGGILELPLGMPSPAANKVVEGFSKHHEGQENWFKTVILRDGAKFHQTTMSPNEGQMNETREQQVREVCRWFNVSPSRLGLSDSVSYNSKAEDNQSYLDSTLSPWLEAITSQAYAKLLSQTQRDAESHFFEHNTKALLRMDAQKRFVVYAMAIQRGILSPNECRRAENMPPREGGDEYVDIVAASGGKDLPGIDGANQNVDPPVPGDAPKNRSHEVNRIVYAVASRARHKAKNARAFLEWIDGDLKSFRAEALTACGSDEIVGKAVAELRAIAETTVENELVAAVDAAMTNYERGDE